VEPALGRVSHIPRDRKFIDRIGSLGLHSTSTALETSRDLERLVKVQVLPVLI